MSGEICTDNRFEIIAAYKKKLIERTNIQSRPEEMAVIDNVLFRFWQLDWLPPVPHGRLIDADALMKGEGRYIISFGKEGIDVAEISRAPTIIPAEDGA